MKKSHVFALITIAIMLAIIVGTFYQTDTYGDFKTAKTQPDKTFQIIGKLDKSKPVTFDSLSSDPILTFYMIDENNDIGQVVYYGEKPRDFDKLEQVVVTGYMRGDFFEASELLLKCPSKYTKETEENKKFESGSKK